MLQGDCRATLVTLEAESVNCIVTSPPYWGLRKYSGEQDTVWGGLAGCEHTWMEQAPKSRGHPGDKTTLVSTQTASLSKAAVSQGATCSRCEAWRGALGLEPTADMFIAHLMEVMAALWRVLRKDGVCWVNLDDTRQSGDNIGNDGGPKQARNRGSLNVQRK